MMKTKIQYSGLDMTFPVSIENGQGEKIVFQSIENGQDGRRVILDGYCREGCGPAMHTHFRQDEKLTVVSGQMAYQAMGQEVRQVGPGDTVVFEKGTPHKFWSLKGELHIRAEVYPAHSFIYFISAVYAAQKKSGKPEPDPYDAAFLLTKYASEYDMPEIPGLVKHVLFPLTVFIGRLLGKYRHFSDAPEALPKVTIG